ncbi:MAG TPA: PDZ domain-containing protein [Pirellulaceae bacterium]|nr:PDZ domain-containing protein [Pirellulaceae bacterium]
MTLGRCSNEMKVWRRWMLAAGIGCVVVATSLPAWAQVPPVPAVPDPPVDAAADAATDVDAAADAATNVDADAATNVEARAENPANATTQADAAAEAATDAAPGAINAQGELNADVDADRQAPRLQGDAAVDVDADADIRNRRGGATDAQIGVDTQTRFGAAADVQDGRLILGNVAANSLAASAGLLASDEIVSINGTQVRTRAAYDRALLGASGPAAIQYRRGGQLYTANVDLPPVPPQRQQSFYRGADAVQSGNAMQKHGSPVQKGGYSNGPVQKGYYSDAGGGGGRQGHHRQGQRQRRGYR